MVDSVYRTRSLGVAAEGLPDQYADGKAAKVWEYYIGCKQTRTSAYKNFLLKHLKELGCKSVLDVACGTGVDSITLVEEGFEVVSTDASDKMLKFALKERWDRRKEPHFDNWVIDEANWLTLSDDLEDIGIKAQSFDAVLCLGNSFAHLPDFEGDQSQHTLALSNFKDMVKPGGILMVDHRNYDEILHTGHVPKKNIYYNSDHIVDIKCSNLYVDGHAKMTTFDYVMDMTLSSSSNPITDATMRRLSVEYSRHQFRLSYYPHQLTEFKRLLKDVFPKGAEFTTYADFEPEGKVEDPGYYVHVIKKPKTKNES